MLKVHFSKSLAGGAKLEVCNSGLFIDAPKCDRIRLSNGNFHLEKYLKNQRLCPLSPLNGALCATGDMFPLPSLLKWHHIKLMLLEKVSAVEPADFRLFGGRGRRQAEYLSGTRHTEKLSVAGRHPS